MPTGPCAACKSLHWQQQADGSWVCTSCTALYLPPVSAMGTQLGQQASGRPVKNFGTTAPARRASFVIRTQAELVPQINGDKMRFVLEQLPKRGPAWARSYMTEVEGFDKWSVYIQRQVLAAEAERDLADGQVAD